MNKLIVILILLSVSCKSKKTEIEPTNYKIENENDITAQIIKIDSIENYYLVFIRKDYKFFQLISDKNQTKHYESIKLEIGGKYKFRIQQEIDIKPNDQSPRMMAIDLVECEYFKKTKICSEPPFKLAQASNLKGLYIINK